MEYYYIQNNEQRGPVSFEELCSMDLQPNTMVWHEGLTDWQEASKLPELAPYFAAQNNAQTPPPHNNPSYTTYSDEANNPQNGGTQSQYPGSGSFNEMPNYNGGGYGMNNNNGQLPPMPPTNLVWAILTTILCCLPFGIVAIVYATRVEPNYYSGNYEKARRNSYYAATWSIVSAVVSLLSPFIILSVILMNYFFSVFL